MAVVVAATISACATEEAAQKAEGGKMLDAKGLQALFKEGGGSCKWTQGGTKGEDFYYATASKSGGEADRNIGDKLVQGSWALKGDKLCVNFGTEECSGLEEVGKKKYKASYGGKATELSC